MSEEKPTFKVTDRRLFNTDGSPRGDMAREEEKPAPAAVAPPPPPTPDPPPAATAGPPDAAASPQRETAQPKLDVADSPARRERTETDDSRGSAAAEQQQQQQSRGGGVAEEADPTPFANLVMFIASPAAAAMGMTEHPGLAPGEVDLPLAKHCIDLLAIVREKSHGNLGQQEQQIIDGLLTELRMQYVSLTSAPRPAPAPRGFTGGDITGGR